MSNNRLRDFFPMLRTREEILREIGERETLSGIFNSWREKYRKEFLDFCTGARGVKMLYDCFAKEILNPEIYPERLNELLSLVLGTEVTILQVLPNDNTRLADESSLLVMDIVVKLADGSVANVEIQKVGYAFPGQRCACYSADLLLRQYKMVRSGKREHAFSYRDIKNVYTIVLLEKSGKNFHEYPEDYLHYFEQRSSTGIELELLQKYIFIPIDIFLKNRQNKDIGNRLEAWLTFLGSDDPEDIIRVIGRYPDFKTMYGQIYGICQNMEKVMELFSRELLELDRNTVKYMMDEMQDEIDRQKEILRQVNEEMYRKNEELNQKREELNQKKEELSRKDLALAAKDRELQEALRLIEELKGNR